MMDINIYCGVKLKKYIDTVSMLRIKIFKEFPYLYEGELNYERSYLEGYCQDPYSMLAVALINGNVVGVSTGIPLLSSSTIISDAKKVFSQKNVDINDYYYYGEVMILPEFRGQGIIKKLYSAQDELIKTWGFNHVSILTVVRENNHPLKPRGYKSSDKMWRYLGFIRNNLTIQYSWPTLQPDNSVKDTINTLEFWTKSFSSI